MMFAAAQAAKVNHDGNNQNQQIDACHWLPCIRHPGVCQRC
jgi:hypothetical protein